MLEYNITYPNRVRLVGLIDNLSCLCEVPTVDKEEDYHGAAKVDICTHEEGTRLFTLVNGYERGYWRVPNDRIFSPNWDELHNVQVRTVEYGTQSVSDMLSCVCGSFKGTLGKNIVLSQLVKVFLLQPVAKVVFRKTSTYYADWTKPVRFLEWG